MEPVKHLLLPIVGAAILVVGITVGSRHGSETPEGSEPFQETEPTPVATQSTPLISPDAVTSRGTAETAPVFNGLRGIAIDDEQQPLANVDILYHLIEVTSVETCGSESSEALELAVDTHLIQSDSDGSFLIPLAAAELAQRNDRCLIASATLDGYFSTTVTLPLAYWDQEVEIELPAQRALSGRVLTANGDGAAQASISAWAATEEDCDAGDISDETQSDDRGQFLLALKGRDYCVQASHPQWANSAAVWVPSSQRDGLTLMLAPTVSVNGTLQDLAEQLVIGLPLELLSEDGQVIARAESDNAGSFRFVGLNYGRYNLHTPNPNYGIALPAKLVINEGRLPSDTLTVSVFNASRIQGRVLDPAGSPIAGVQASLYTRANSRAMTQTLSDARGYFELVQTQVANHSRTDNSELCVALYHPDFRHDALSLNNTAEPQSLGDLTMSAPAITLRGRVVNHRDEPLAAQLVVTEQAALEQHPRSCGERTPARELRSDERGEFFLHVDRLGMYSVEVSTDRYRPRTVAVDIADPNQPLTINIR